MADTKTAQSGLKEELPEQRHLGDVRPLGNVPGPRVSYKPLERVDSGSGISYLSGMYTSPAEEERLRKASVQRQRIMAVGDALRHLGNIYYTSRYAPAQRFSNPVEEERVRYLRDKGERDKDNVRFMSYQQAKAQQDYRRERLEADRDYREQSLRARADELAARKNRYGLDARKQEWKEQIDARLADLKEQAEQNKKDYNEKKINIDEYNARSRRISAEASRLRASRSGGGGFTNEYNDDGKLVKRTPIQVSSSPSVGWDDNESGPSVGW